MDGTYIMSIRKKEWIAVLFWMVVLLVLDVLSKRYSIFNPIQPFVFPICLIGSWGTRFYLKKLNEKEK